MLIIRFYKSIAWKANLYIAQVSRDFFSQIILILFIYWIKTKLGLIKLGNQLILLHCIIIILIKQKHRKKETDIKKIIKVFEKMNLIFFLLLCGNVTLFLFIILFIMSLFICFLNLIHYVFIFYEYSTRQE